MHPQRGNSYVVLAFVPRWKVFASVLNNAIVKTLNLSCKTQTNLPGEKTHLSLKLSKLAKTAKLKISLIKAIGELRNHRKSTA